MSVLRFPLLAAVALFLGVVLCPVPAWSKTPQAEAAETVSIVLRQLDRLVAQEAEAEEIALLGRQLAEPRKVVVRCQQEMALAIDESEAEMALLGREDPAEPKSVSVKRRKLLAQRTDLDEGAAACRLLLLDIDRAAAAIEKARQESLTRHLLAHGPPIAEVLGEVLQTPFAGIMAIAGFLAWDSGFHTVTRGEGIAFALVIAAAAWLAHILRRRLAPKTGTPQRRLGAAFVLSLRSCFVRQAKRTLLPWAAAAWALFVLPVDHPPFATMATVAAGLFFTATLLLRALLRPCPPATDYLPLAADVARPLGRRLSVLMAVTTLGFIFFTTTGIRQVLPEAQHQLFRAIFLGAFVVNLVWIAWLTGQTGQAARTRALRGVLVLVLIGCFIAELAGYRNLSVAVLSGLTLTAVALATAWFLSRVTHEVFDGLDAGREGWPTKVRAWLGIPAGESMPGLVWARLFSALTIWGLFTLVVGWVWHLWQPGEARLLDLLSLPVQVGSAEIVPGRILGALGLFAVLMNLVRWFTRRVIPEWTAQARLDEGGRTALASITGYVGIAIAALVALSVSGVQMTNLAVIAGALSVGIGFGLQTIVSNFISGIILLFERPIRPGDWIAVGTTQGYVRKISIRATQIETFDHADVIVPNSELITKEVTNWMLRDSWGRVTVPVGVAYGSDTEKVSQLLLEVANAHPLVMKNSPAVPSPKILFMGFGDSALNFELRCFIRQVDRRADTISDLNFAIEALFRREGIEIPYRQTEIRIKGAPVSLPVAPEPEGTTPDRPASG